MLRSRMFTIMVDVQQLYKVLVSLIERTLCNQAATYFGHTLLVTSWSPMWSHVGHSLSATTCQTTPSSPSYWIPESVTDLCNFSPECELHPIGFCFQCDWVFHWTNHLLFTISLLCLHFFCSCSLLLNLPSSVYKCLERE